MQETFDGSCEESGSACSRLTTYPNILFRSETTVYVCFALLLFADSWLAYKTTLVTVIGVYFVIFL